MNWLQETINEHLQSLKATQDAAKAKKKSEQDEEKRNQQFVVDFYRDHGNQVSLVERNVLFALKEKDSPFKVSGAKYVFPISFRNPSHILRNEAFLHITTREEQWGTSNSQEGSSSFPDYTIHTDFLLEVPGFKWTISAKNKRGSFHLFMIPHSTRGYVYRIDEEYYLIPSTLELVTNLKNKVKTFL